MQKVKILRIKYGWPENVTDSDIKFVYRMVKCNGADLFQDLREFTNYNSSIKKNAYLYAINTLTISGLVARAIKLYDDLGAQYTQSISGVLLCTATALIRESMNDKDEFGNYMELIKHIISRDDSAFGKNVYDNLHKVNTLREIFDLNVTKQSLENSHTKNELLQNGIQNLIGKLKQSPANFEHNAMKFIQLLATALNVDGVRVTMHFCRELKNVQLSCALARMVLDLYTANMQNAGDFIDMAVLLLAQQTQMIDEAKCERTTMAYPLAQRLLLMVQEVNIVYYDEICDLLRWTRIGTHSFDTEQVDAYMESNVELDEETITSIVENITNGHDEVHEQRRNSLSIFDTVKDVNSTSTATTKPERVIKCLSLALANMINDIKVPCTFTKRFVDYKITKSNTARGELTSNIEQLIKTKQPIVAFLIIQFVRQIQHKGLAKIIGKDSLVAFVKRMLKIALMSKDVHFDRK